MPNFTQNRDFFYEVFSKTGGLDSNTHLDYVIEWIQRNLKVEEVFPQLKDWQETAYNDGYIDGYAEARENQGYDYPNRRPGK